MIHCECALDTDVCGGAATPVRLVIQLNADTGPAGYKLRGVLEIEDLDAWRLEAMQAALVRTLGKRCTLMLGPPDLDNVLDGHNAETAARRIARTYHWSPGQLAAKAGISEPCAKSLLTETHGRAGKTCRAIATLTIRLADAPTPGEVLRRQRRTRQRSVVAAQIGVSEETLRRWEDDEELVPFAQADAVRHALGIPPGGLQVAPPPAPLGIASPGTAPPPEEIRDGRVRKRMSQRDLAARIGVSPCQISNWERGVYTPWPRNAEALREVLGLDVDIEPTVPAGAPAA